jgi:hypothetical protein
MSSNEVRDPEQSESPNTVVVQKLGWQAVALDPDYLHGHLPLRGVLGMTRGKFGVACMN